MSDADRTQLREQLLTALEAERLAMGRIVDHLVAHHCPGLICGDMHQFQDDFDAAEGARIALVSTYVRG